MVAQISPKDLVRVRILKDLHIGRSGSISSNINYLTFTTMKTISEEFERLLRETARIQEEYLAVVEEIKQLLKSYKSNCNHSKTEE